jgi:NADP-dependent 3-hydroxy acid dehydrogenase YdfG
MAGTPHPQDWEAMIDVNVKGLLHGIAAALPLFRGQGFGQFVNVLSTVGLKIVPTARSRLPSSSHPTWTSARS